MKYLALLFVSAILIHFSQSNNHFRIVNGLRAKEGQFPWQVSIQREDNDHFCGGTVLNENWVLTAAHCVSFNDVVTPSEELIITSNVSELSSGGDAHKVVHVIPHEDYDPETMYADIALLATEETIEISRFAKLHEEQIGANENVTAVGWSSEYYGGEVNNHLQYRTFKTVPTEECDKIIRDGDVVLPSHICIFSKKQHGTCTGDSGGPLVLANTDLLVGVNSWGAADLCAAGYPDVFVRVSSFYNWILSTMEDTSLE